MAEIRYSVNILLLVNGEGRENTVKSTSSIASALEARNIEATVQKLHIGETCSSYDLPDEDSVKFILIVILLNDASKAHILKGRFSDLHKDIIRKYPRLRSRTIHVIKNFPSSQTDEQWSLNEHSQRLCRVWDLEKETVNQLAEDFEATIQAASKFGSPGGSFAWQLVVGFLSYILCNLRDQIRSALLDDAGLIRQDFLNSYGLDDLDPQAVLVVPRFHLILDESIVSSQHPATVTSSSPQRLFDGCSKICNGTEELNLEFDSPGYKKRIPVYLMELDAPLSRGDSTFTHVVIFGGFAAPLFVMQKLPMTDDEKAQMFEQFRDELMLIQKHPRANAVLRKLSDSSTGGVVESEPSALCVIHATDEGSLRSSILADIEDFLLCDGWSIVSRSFEQPSEESAKYDSPIISMSFAMAANTWLGFADHLLKNIKQLSADEPIPFDLPYLFVIPKSGRYPDDSKLLSRFDEIGAQTSLQEFRVSGGRRYSYRVVEWKSRRIAFEIPTSVLGIRKQAESGIGGIAAGDLTAHLAEFRDALRKFVSDSADRFKVVEWDDDSDFDENTWAEPSCDFALSLLRFLFE